MNGVLALGRFDFLFLHEFTIDRRHRRVAAGLRVPFRRGERLAREKTKRAWNRCETFRCYKLITTLFGACLQLETVNEFCKRRGKCEVRETGPFCTLCN